MSKRADLTGMKFGRLTVLGYSNTVSGSAVWDCSCECGKTTSTTTKSLRSGDAISCGCYAQEVRALNGKKNMRHGDAGTKLYSVWSHMKKRCTNNSHPAYHNYGGRGISVCSEWSEYENFKSWAEPNGYREGLTIDRIDNNGDYEPINCRWVTNKVQQRNKRNTIYLTHEGMTKSIADWSEETGIKYATLWKRVRKYGFTDHDALQMGRHQAEVFVYE